MNPKEEPRAFKSGRPPLPLDRDRILKMRSKNYSLDQIAREVGASKSTVYRRVRRLVAEGLLREGA